MIYVHRGKQCEYTYIHAYTEYVKCQADIRWAIIGEFSAILRRAQDLCRWAIIDKLVAELAKVCGQPIGWYVLSHDGMSPLQNVTPASERSHVIGALTDSRSVLLHLNEQVSPNNGADGQFS